MSFSGSSPAFLLVLGMHIPPAPVQKVIPGSFVCFGQVLVNRGRDSLPGAGDGGQDHGGSPRHGIAARKDAAVSGEALLFLDDSPSLAGFVSCIRAMPSP
jgi:hypothetical protein